VMDGRPHADVRETHAASVGPGGGGCGLPWVTGLLVLKAWTWRPVRLSPSGRARPTMSGSAQERRDGRGAPGGPGVASGACAEA